MFDGVVRDQAGRVTHRVLFESQLCEILNVPADRLRAWGEMFPPSGVQVHPDRARPEPVFQLTAEQIDRYQKYARILSTGMTVQQVRELEAADHAKEAKTGKPGSMLTMYAKLAEECPPGVTAHNMRSFCVLIVYQNRAGQMLLPEDLARAASIPQETARRHIEQLIHAGLLTLQSNPPRWEFEVVPKALSRYFPT